MKRVLSVARTVLTAGTVLSQPGCRGDEGRGRPLFATLAQAAWESHTRHEQAVDAGRRESSPEIPAEFWAPGIRDLCPSKVYRHRGNFAEVQESSDGVEEGVYICHSLSSYIPVSGDDGFTFTRLEQDVWRFKRRTDTEQGH